MFRSAWCASATVTTSRHLSRKGPRASGWRSTRITNRTINGTQYLRLCWRVSICQEQLCDFRHDKVCIFEAK